MRRRRSLRRTIGIASGSGGATALAIWVISQHSGQPLPVTPTVTGGVAVMAVVSLAQLMMPPGGLARLAAQVVGVLSRTERFRMLRAMRRKFEEELRGSADPQHWESLLNKTNELGHDLERDLADTADEGPDEKNNPTNGTTDVP